MKSSILITAFIACADAGEHEKNATANGKDPGDKRPGETSETAAGAHAGHAGKHEGDAWHGWNDDDERQSARRHDVGWKRRRNGLIRNDETKRNDGKTYGHDADDDGANDPA